MPIMFYKALTTKNRDASVISLGKGGETSASLFFVEMCCKNVIAIQTLLFILGGLMPLKLFNLLQKVLVVLEAQNSQPQNVDLQA